ncbi:hypothetical protein V5O48_013180 [Marasmius crinis-equi]|uniref:Uncharacterized protein n=1 Tax=Marasmius crinis-equi TaxID=585013 RepID=A0ABR3F145_9AGAR
MSFPSEQDSDKSDPETSQRTVTDPVTHLPIEIHDNTTVELERIPPSDVSKGKDKHKKSDEKQADVQTSVEEEVSKGRWDDKAVSEARLRTQAAVLAAVAAGAGGTLSLLLSQFLSRATGAGGSSIWADLLIGSIGSALLGLGAGAFVFYYDQHEKEKRSDGNKGDEKRAWKRDPPQEKPESAAWLNSFLDTLWPIVNPALFTPLSDMVEDALQTSLPKFVNGVRVADLGQGSEAVRIIGLRWLDGGDNDVDQGDYVNLEAAVSYRTQSKGPGLQGQAGCMHLLIQFWLPGGVVMPVWVELTGLLATARLKLALTPNPPFLSTMTLTLLGKPKVVLSATPMAKNFLNVMDVPGLSAWVQEAIDTAIAAYIAPRSLTLDLKTLLMGREKMDTEAIGVLVVTIKRAEGFKTGDSSKVWKSEEGRYGDPYVTVGWGKWGKPIWSTRTIQNEHQPIWEETNYLLVTPAELNAQETLKLQIWDSDRLTADDILGVVEIPLKDLMRSSEFKNRITERSDELVGDDGTKWPGSLVWSVGYFDKTSLAQHLTDKDADAKEIEKQVKEAAQDKLREAESRRHAENPEIEQQTEQDMNEKGQEIIAGSPPPAEWPSGILSVTIEQITGLEVPNVRQSGTHEDMEQEESDQLPSAYCTVIINHEREYQTRTKMKTNNPYLNAGTEKFIKDWRQTVVMIAVRDARLHENDPLIGVVVLPLKKLLKDGCQITDSFPLVGGMGFGRVKCSLLFRSLQAKLPRPILGWNTGTVEIFPESIRPSGDFPSELQSCRMLLRTLYGKAKVYPGQADDGEQWQSKRGRPVRLAVKKRAASCLLLQFRKRVLGPDQTPAFGTLWLREIPDEEVVTVKVAIRRNKGNALMRGRGNASEEIGDKIGELEMKVKFWPGLSPYHNRLAKKDAGIADCMDVLKAAEDDDGGVEKFDDDGPDDDSSSSSSSSSSENEGEDDGKKHGNGLIGRLGDLKDGAEDYNDRKEELHRKHRGLMQWGVARKMAWVGKEVEDTAKDVKQGVKGRLKHQQRDNKIETEV